MLKVPAVDICIESPRQSEYVNIVSSENQNRYILGHGSYGRVYKAIYRDQPVAVKIIRKTNKEAANSVTRESNILGWNHDNIIKILKITSLDDCFTIIMERFTGVCLQQLLNQMKIPLWHRTRISLDVMNGLDFCHARNLVHLDVKPQNVFVAFGGDSQRNYICKLFDFGCSTFIHENNPSTNQRGTIRYMSPDILQGFTIGLHDDIYSFGITMWQLKSNADPYYNIASNEFVAYHVVKSNLRPDSQLKHFGISEKGNEENVLKTISSAELSTNDSVNINSKSSSCLMTIKRPKRLLTPNNIRDSVNINSKISTCHLMAMKQTGRLLTPINVRKPFEKQFLSTGHNRRQIKGATVVSSAVVKKLDFNSMSNVNRIPLTSRTINKNQPTVKATTNNNSDSTIVNKNEANFFKDAHQHLPKEKLMEIEISYENIFKQCWEQEAIKRPSSQTILDLLQSTIHLFD